MNSNSHGSSVKSKLHHHILDLVGSCFKCGFGKNGRALPYFGSNAKYLIIGEAPHTEEIKQGFPFVGDSGERLWKAIKSLINMDRDDFIIFNSVMCKPTAKDGQSIGKPTRETIDSCFIKRTDILKYLYDFYAIRHILCLGGYARYIFKGSLSGITDASGNTETIDMFDREFSITYCLHPAASMYNPTNRGLFEESIVSFGKVVR